MSLQDIDFAERYRAHVRRAGRPQRSPAYWDRRADRMRAGVFRSEYARQFVDRMRLDGCRTLLDVGCGPGTIGLSVASRLSHVYGLDYSPGMLASFAEEARARGLGHVTTILRAWEEDWDDVPACDIVVASRATAVGDFEAAAKKLCAKARRRVYVSYPAHGHFVGDDVCRYLGRTLEPLPDYLDVLGILHHLGLDPALEFIADTNRFAGLSHADDFIVRARDLIGNLTEEEAAALRGYYASHRDRIDRERMRWALLSWDIEETARERRWTGSGVHHAATGAYRRRD
jgi:SAM-dependent methyltransferase